MVSGCSTGWCATITKIVSTATLTEIRFYHLQRTSLEHALPVLLEKTLERGWRAVVMARSRERVDSLNGMLWTYRNDSFLPHGGAEDGNGAVSENVGMFDLCCELFDGSDAETVNAARTRWTAYLKAGHHLNYWQQNAGGGWEKKAEANGPQEKS